MDELIRQVNIIVRGMWRWRWLGLAAAWIVGIAAAVAILRIPDKYEATARIYVDTQSVLTPLMSGLAVQPNVDQQISILSRTLISRPNVEKLVRMADLDLGISSKPQQESLVDDLMKTLQIQTAGRDNLYTLSFRDPQPEKAKKVVQSLASIFVESSLGGKRKDSDSAKKFLDDQIKVYEKKLEEAENRLKEFKLRQLNVSSDGKDFYGRMGDATGQLNQARLELREAQNSRDSYKRQLAGEEPGLIPEGNEAAAASSVVPEIDGRIDALKRQLDGMLQRFTEEHPDVIGTKRVIEQLEEQKKAELAMRRRAPGQGRTQPAPINSNPVYQQLKVSLAETEATVASLQTRVSEYETRVLRLQQSAKMVPQVEAEYSQLNRDYDINKKNYEGLVSRRESAEISGEMEASAGVADFRLIDPPRVSPQPVAPNRAVLFPMALIAAIGAGLLVSFLASQIRPTFFEPLGLSEVTGLPVLGAVSMITGEEQRRRERRGLIGFISAVIAFLASFGGGLTALYLLSTRTV